MLEFDNGVKVSDGHFVSSDWWLTADDGLDEVIFGIKIIRSDISRKEVKKRIKRKMKELGIKGRVFDEYSISFNSFKTTRGYKSGKDAFCRIDINKLPASLLRFHESGLILREVDPNDFRKENIDEDN